MEHLKRNFTHHAPNPVKARLHETLRNRCFELGDYFNTVLPVSREKTLAITKLEEAMFWASACVARNPIPDTEDEPRYG